MEEHKQTTETTTNEQETTYVENAEYLEMVYQITCVRVTNGVQCNSTVQLDSFNALKKWVENNLKADSPFQMCQIQKVYVPLK